MERSGILAARNKFLMELIMNRYSRNPRPEIYLDESWVSQNTSVEQYWTNKEGIIGPHTKTGRGGRFFILHAGFVPGRLLLFKSKAGNKGDFHDAMNCHTFRKWFLEQLLPNVPPK